MVNALSENLNLNIYRDGNEYEIKFKDGNSIKPLRKLENKNYRNKNYFSPIKEIFSQLSSALQY